ncbi:MAG: opioid growth factor receptor-related protein [Bryobacterales bacterium]|nr:opioid growth factor receptor-related protein [Bryobacterales bacterium]
MTPLLAFYLGSHPDHQGRMLAEILRQDDAWLELAHDYIQWLFPLAEFSRVVPGAPVLSRKDLMAFRSDPLLRGHMLVALDRMLRFYGLERRGTSVATAFNWNARRDNWFTEDTHNSLRITRILKSLMLVGLEAEAKAFHECLRELCATDANCAVSTDSRAYWLHAVADGAARAV